MEAFDDFEKYHQTKKFYEEIKTYYRDIGVDATTPFPIVAVYINYCIRKFNTRHYGYKPKQKVIYLSMKYLDEIEYPFHH